MKNIDKSDTKIIYDNHVNEIRLKGFKKKDMDLFLTVCKFFMEENTCKVRIPYSSLKKLADYKKMTKSEFDKNIKGLDEKFYSLIVAFDDEENEYYNSKPLFIDFTADGKKQELNVEINEKAVAYFNVFKQYTKIDLLIHTSLSSKYSATLYRMLCQYDKNNWWCVTIENFKEIFNVPQSYDSRKISQKILDPAVEELSKYMDISYIVEKDEHKRGKPVKGYKFEYSVNKSKNDSRSKAEKQEDKKEPTEDLFDKIIELIDNAQLGIGTKSTMSCAKKAVELNRDIPYIEDVINIVKTQNNENTAGKLMYLIVNGYDKPKQSKKPNGFNNFQQRDIDIDGLEKMLLEKNLFGTEDLKNK